MVRDGLENDLPECLGHPEPLPCDRDYRVGDSLHLADITVRSLMADTALCEVGVDLERFPNTGRYVASLHTRPSFAKFATQEAAMLSGD